ncbi:MAG TPA: hypothetical protein VFJ99_03470 [Solirubrobacterales bacterium]|nr:hypothetical protein [Solirubrobacterales bacterium]
MLSPLRNRFGIPGVISVIALVFAMLGGAYAASNSGGGKGKTASAKAKKGPRGPRGPQGPAGADGAQGPQGLPGANGKDGANGSNGNGIDGKSVVVEEIEIGELACNGFGGIEVAVEGSGEVEQICNGEEGTNGTSGDPWTAGGTLPVNATETGAWDWGVFGSAADQYAPISFNVPLAAPLPAANVHYVPNSVQNATGSGNLTSGSATVTNLTTATGKFNKGSSVFGAGIPAGATIVACVPASCNNSTELTLSAAATESGTAVALTAGVPAGCTGGTVASPQADSGHLCVYEQSNVLATFVSIASPTAGSPPPGASVAGALIVMKGIANGSRAFGTWAVTG